MPKISYIITASRAIRDQSTSKMSFIDVFDSFNIPATQKETTEFFVITGRITNVPAGQAIVEVKLNKPNGELLQESKLSGNLTAGDLDFTAQFNFVTVSDPGRYPIQIFFNNELLEDDGRYYISAVKLV